MIQLLLTTPITIIERSNLRTPAGRQKFPIALVHGFYLVPLRFGISISDLRFQMNFNFCKKRGRGADGADHRPESITATSTHSCRHFHWETAFSFLLVPEIAQQASRREHHSPISRHIQTLTFIHYQGCES